DANRAIRATEIPRLAKLHATGLDRNDHARDRSNFLTNSKIEANGSVLSSSSANGDGLICDPCTVDAAFERASPHILKRNGWRYISRTLGCPNVWTNDQDHQNKHLYSVLQKEIHHNRTQNSHGLTTMLGAALRYLTGSTSSFQSCILPPPA